MSSTNFVRIPGTRQFRLMANGLQQFFLLVYCVDGSLCKYGPFASGEEALQQQAEIENPSFECYGDMED